MFVVDIEKSLPKPPREILEKCYKVELKGTKPYLKKRWALAHCDSYFYMDVDWTELEDPTYIFYFYNEADKLMFALKYS